MNDCGNDRLLRDHGATLLRLAAHSICHGLRFDRPLPVVLDDYAEDLRADAASFVTLRRRGELRGCIGTAEAYRPLAADVAANGFAAAFRDGRFPRLAATEPAALTLSVSVLSAPEPLACESETALLDRLRPGRDGLIIESEDRRALFLPQVWQLLPERREFVIQLKVKAGLPKAGWPDDLRAWRFAAWSISSDSLPDPAALWSAGH
jgi:AmmeMemoRadiSam system protein A